MAKPPEPPRLSVKVSKELKDDLRQWAKAHRRPLSEIMRILAEALLDGRIDIERLLRGK